MFSASVETELIACSTERPVVELASFSAHGLATDAITGFTAGLMVRWRAGAGSRGTTADFDAAEGARAFLAAATALLAPLKAIRRVVGLAIKALIVFLLTVEGMPLC